MTFSSIAYEWLESKRKTVRAASFAAYSTLLNMNILPILGDVEEVTEADVRSMLDRLQETGTVPSSLRNYAMVVKNVLKFGADKGYCQFPGWSIPLTSSGSARREGLILLTEREEKRLVKYLVENPSPRNLGYLLLLLTGIKAGELYALKWSSVDQEKGFLNIVDSKYQFYMPNDGSGKGEMKITDDIDVHLRRIPLPEKLVSYLRPFADKADPDTYLVSGSTVFIQRPKTIRDTLRIIAKNLDIPAVSPQDLRHTFAVRCIQSGCDLVTLMNLMGVSEAGPMYNLYEPYFKTYTKDAMTARLAKVSLPK